MNLGSYVVSCTEINSRYIVDPDVKSKTLKLPEDGIEE